MRVIVAARRNSSRALDAAELEQEITPHAGQEMVGLAMESFFALLQKNVLDRQRWATREDLRLAIITWI